MNAERLTALVLERRYGVPTPEEAAELDAALRDPAAAAEAERLTALLDAAPAASVGARAEFDQALARRIEVEGAAERGRRHRRWFARLAVAYAGVAAGALLYASAQGWFSGEASSDVRSTDTAQLELPSGSPTKR